MAPERTFEPIAAESTSGSSIAGGALAAESPNHPGHPDFISRQHDPYNTNRQFEQLHGPLGTVQTNYSQYNETRNFEPIHTHTSPRQDVEVRPGDRAELQRIASVGALSRTLTAKSGNNLSRRDTFADVGFDDPTLDPNTPEFDAYKFARVVMRLINEKGLKTLKSGFVFKELRVTGTGSSLQYQQTVSSVMTAPLRVGKLFQKGKERVILKQFEGVVKTGELLVVLGRPGSGCSTLLKTLMGETYGYVLFYLRQVLY